MKGILKFAAAAAIGMSLSAVLQAGVSADNRYDCKLSSLVVNGAQTDYGNGSDVITIDDYTTADLSYEGTYVDASGTLYLGGSNNGKGSYTNGSYVEFTAPMPGKLTVTGMGVNGYENGVYNNSYIARSAGTLTKTLAAGDVYQIGQRVSGSYITGISFTPAEGYDYIDFDDLSGNTYGDGESVFDIGSNTSAYLTYTGTYVDGDGVLHLTSEGSGKGNLTNRSYIEFTAPTSGTVSFVGNYVNYYLNGTYKAYANNYSAALNAGDKLQIAARDSNRSTLSRITFAPYYGSYVFADNQVNLVGSDAYNTVIIYKDGDMADEDIVYIGQAHGRFSAATSFALKKNPEDGKYIVWLGGTAEKKSEFYIGMRLNESASVKCTKVFTDENQPDTVAFGWENVEPAAYKSILVKLDDEVYGFAFDGPTISGSGVNLGVELTGLEAFTSAEAYLSPLSIDEAANAVTGGN